MARIRTGVLLLIVLDVLLLGASLWNTRYLLDRARVPLVLREANGTLIVDDVLDATAAGGLEPGTAIATVDGIAVRNYHDVEFLADLRTIGDTIRVRVHGDGTDRSAAVRLIPFFSLRYAVICLLIGIVTLATAIFVLLARPADRTAGVLHATLACVAFAVMLMWGAAPREDPWTIASRVGYFVFYIGGAASFLHFTFLFPRPARGLTRSRAILLYVPALLVAILALWTHLHAILGGSLERYREFRPFYWQYRGVVLVYAALGVANFVRSYRATRAPDEQKKLQWLLWGMAIGPAPFLLLEVLPELFIPLSPVPEEYTLVFLLLIPLSFAVSFVRYHLLDIRVVIHRTTLYGIVLGAFLLLYLATVAVAGAMIGQFTVGVSAVSAVIVALAFEPMRRTLQRLVDRRFFRIRYDFRQAQREFEVELKKRSSEADLARFVVTQVQSLIPVVRIAFVTAPDPAEQPGCLAEISDGRTDGGAEVLGRIWKNLLEDKPYGIPEEIEPGVPCLHLDSGLMDPSGFVVVFPMFSAKSGLLAFLALGRKKSEVRFSSEDIDLLLSIARQVGLEIERIRLQQEVFHKEVEAQRLRDLSELKSNFVSNVSHEFRTPLTSIRLFAELLQNKPAANDKKAREFLAIIEGEAERLDQMVTTILDSSRIERGIRTFSMQECDLRRLVRSVLRTMRYQIRKAGFTVRTVGLSAGKGSIVHGDAQAIIEILGNLIGNAVKYSGSPGVITVGIGRAAKWVTCSVRDRGKGIAPEALGHIFEPYYRAPGSEKKAEGIGLGLPLVKSIMEAHGGKVTAESVVGKGSCFTLYFPRSRVSRRRQERAAN